MAFVLFYIRFYSIAVALFLLLLAILRCCCCCCCYTVQYCCVCCCCCCFTVRYCCVCCNHHLRRRLLCFCVRARVCCCCCCCSYVFIVVVAAVITGAVAAARIVTYRRGIESIRSIFVSRILRRRCNKINK